MSSNLLLIAMRVNFFCLANWNWHWRSLGGGIRVPAAS